jgi:hypothetical protein
MTTPDDRTGGEQQEEYPGPRPPDDEGTATPSGPPEEVPGSQKGAGPRDRPPYGDEHERAST